MPFRNYISVFVLLILTGSTLWSQNNVGIGTDTIHPSARLEIKDSAQGLLVPRTDTSAVNAYVNSLFPNPGIADGLMIYDVNVNTYFYYDGILKRWVQINRLTGAKGTTGITGPTGPTGFQGRSTHWRDSAGAEPVVQAGDSCGDYYHDTKSGFIWKFDCDSNDWVGPITRWRMLGHGLHSYLRGTTLQLAPMPSSPGDSLYPLQGLSTVIRVPPDTVVFITVTSQGMVRKRFSNDSTHNYMKFDHAFAELGNPITLMNHSITVSISPNSFPTPTNPDGQYDKVPWSIATSFKLEGKISPPGNPLPPLDFRTYIIQTWGGQVHAPPKLPGDQSDVIICDGGGGKNGLWENFTVMNVYGIFMRSKKAPFPE